MSQDSVQCFSSSRFRNTEESIFFHGHGHRILVSEVFGIKNLSFIEEPIAKYVVIMYMVMNSVSELSLLMASMADTYTQVSANKHALWRKVRGRVAVLTLDQLMLIPGMRERFLGKISDIMRAPMFSTWKFVQVRISTRPL